MKKIIFILIISMFLKPVFPVIDYVVNYDYIIKVLCENRKTPEMGCNGKCHLMKELAKNSDTDKPLSSNKKNNSSDTIDLLFNPIKMFAIIPFVSNCNQILNVTYTNLYAYLFTYITFHPPSFIS